MFSLDISDRILRLVSLSKKGNKIFLDKVSEIEVPPNIIQEGEILNSTDLVPLIIKLVHNSHYHKLDKRVITCLPERKSFIKLIQINKVSNQNLKSTIETELINHIPFSLDEIYLDWQKVNNKNNKDSNKIDILIGAVPKKIVDDYQEVLKKAKLKPYILEIESVAIARALLPLKLGKQKEGILIIDLGLDRTSFIIFDKGLIQFTSAATNISGNTMTNLICKSLNLSFEEAEKAKKLAGFDKKIAKGLITDALEPNLNELIIKINEIIDFYKFHYIEGNQINWIYLSGGGANLKNIDVVLKERLNLKIQKSNSLINLEKKYSYLISEKNQSSYTTAIGLALRGVFHDYT